MSPHRLALEHTVPRLQRLLRQAADPSFRVTQQRFFREPIRTIGVRTADLRCLAARAAKEYRRARLPWPEVARIAEQSGAAERSRSGRWLS